MNRTYQKIKAKIFPNYKKEKHDHSDLDARFECFLNQPALSINHARLEHLESLGLDLVGKTVLEVGAGIGLHSNYFINKGCTLTISDGNPDNVDEIKKRHPNVDALVFDLNKNSIPIGLKEFDVIYCYGVLYHLQDPRVCLETLAKLCKGIILLETCCSLGGFPEVCLIKDFSGNNQAVSGVGCRPTRSWVMNTLKEQFGYAYLPFSQPSHQDFITDWTIPETQLLYRAVFIGSKFKLNYKSLTENILGFQNKII